MTYLKRALLGVQQEAGSEVQSKENIRQILRESGIYEFYRDAGELPKQLMALHEPTCSAKPKRSCSPEAAELMGQILDGRFGDLLLEQLELFKQSQVGIPAYLLPPLLDKASKVYTLRPQVLEQLPDTGFYLASLNPDWGYAEGSQLSLERFQKDWQTASSSLRQGIFYQARMQDPAMARRLMLTSWKSETPASQNWIIRLMATGLNLEDEAFLEQALDDRNLSIRRKASELLSCLPESRLAARMTAIAQEQVQLDSGELKFEQPELSPELLRDGFLLRAWKDDAKLKQAYLADLVSAVPLEHWQENWQLEPFEVLESFRHSENREGMLKGLATAAERQKNISWMKVLILEDGLSMATLKLISQLDEASFLETARHFALETEANDHAFAKALSRWTVSWTEQVFELWQSQIGPLTEQLILETRHLFILRSLFKQAARFAPEANFEGLKQILEGYAKRPEIGAAIQESQSLLKFRKRMYQACGLGSLQN